MKLAIPVKHSVAMNKCVFRLKGETIVANHKAY